MILTPLPSWTTTPAGGTGELTVPARVPDAATALAAHAAVVGLLSTETEVTTELRLPSGQPVVTGVDVDRPSWRDLLSAAASRCAADRHPEQPPAWSATCRQPGIEIEYRPSDLRISYDLGLFDADHAGRIGRYLTAVIAALASDPDARPGDAELVPPAERAALVRSGATRPLPAKRVHELFAEQAAATPDAIAVVHRASSWTYRELDRAANRIANELLAGGLAAEEVVALQAQRGPHWLAAIIGIFRAGGVYLPVEPDYPQARVETVLSQSGSRRLLDDDALRAMLAGGDDTDPLLPVAADQLAYVYFTSGSTGLPKGAMCEHAGMINHLTAKIDDFGLVSGDVVVQNAQASFDISLWQAVAPLLVGGRTAIVDRDYILDVPRFCEAISGATVLQLVPSYLDVLLRHLQQHPEAASGQLGSVHTVSVTGEAISKALVKRFFAQLPGRRLINAYGATEASDDTTHEIMTAPPVEELVPVGRPIHNVTVYVLGRRGELVPLGAPGEIAFSGVCVGRGYINDPERTAQAFVQDPFRPGERVYRTGDFGRWLPTGHLEFHGRRDEQVKIHGVRIELGEVESRVLEHDAVRAAAVVVVPLPGADKSLAACYVGDVEPPELAAHLATVLPASAVPARLHRVDTLPLTTNGKVDKRALAALVQQRIADTEPARRTGGARGPDTPTGRRIASAWARALSRPADTIGADDNFFELGGSSLSALRVVAALEGLISLDELVRYPVLSALAAAADGDTGGDTGVMLRLLAGPQDGARLALVCLPYAAGAAINFLPLATAIAACDQRVAVYGLQAPGHDPHRRNERLLELDELAKLVVDEVAALGTPVALWGHCAGAPLALECAHRLGHLVGQVFLAARVCEPDAELAREIAAVVAASDDELAAELVAQGGLDNVEAGLDSAGSGAALQHAGRVYRHDTRCANQYLLDGATRWGGQRLRCPVTVVLATDDPLTDPGRHRSWSRFAESVELAQIDGGGHLFCRTRPEQAAELVLAAVARSGAPEGNA